MRRPPSPAPPVADELGAHVSTAGGIEHAPARAVEIGSRVLQLFTKQPSRWAEPVLNASSVNALEQARTDHGIGAMAAHDAYLINLASADDILRARSYASFCAELRRCELLRIPCLVSHPGNATDGDRRSALARNADEIERALLETGGSVMLLLETTAGSGSALGSTFEELAALRERLVPAARQRVGFCLDTCHVWAAGYDLRDDYSGVMAHLDDALGRDNVRLFHLNDSIGALGSRRDRHAAIGAGALGDEPFRALLLDDRFTAVPKLLETPKGDDAVAADRVNLARLRRLRAG
jgi:deoxyribonuclease-4